MKLHIILFLISILPIIAQENNSFKSFEEIKASATYNERYSEKLCFKTGYDLAFDYYSIIREDFEQQFEICNNLKNEFLADKEDPYNAYSRAFTQGFTSGIIYNALLHDAKSIGEESKIESRDEYFNKVKSEMSWICNLDESEKIEEIKDLAIFPNLYREKLCFKTGFDDGYMYKNNSPSNSLNFKERLEHNVSRPANEMASKRIKIDDPDQAYKNAYVDGFQKGLLYRTMWKLEQRIGEEYKLKTKEEKFIELNKSKKWFYDENDIK